MADSADTVRIRRQTGKKILILIATGTHRSLTNAEIKEMLDERVFLNNIRVVNHASSNIANLSFLGKTKRGGSRILVNSDYMKADIKILTGVVESHFMAGFSGGAKVNLPRFNRQR